jgi:hypothetical protein
MIIAVTTDAAVRGTMILPRWRATGEALMRRLPRADWWLG